MVLTKEKAKENLAKLINKFEKELSSGRVQEYNEEATKISFIQPLLEHVLGWEVVNHEEVSPEEKISRGRVDYGLKVEGKIKVFVEAKPVKADLNRHIEQAVRYGYNRKDVPFVLLTDFEGMKLFDVTIKPDLRNPLKGVKIDLSWQEYLKNFDKIWLLSKESAIKGELDKLLVVKPKERHTVDKAILDDLKEWRETLAKDIFKNNPKLFHGGDSEKDAHYLKEITQEIIDRIIFIRSCEDRNLVYQRTLKELFGERAEAAGLNAMLFLKEEFKQYNRIFDSDLFRPQEWEDDLVIDFKLMLQIISETYNPYQFDVIPIEVLGNIYEQYLGYIIRITEHQIKYELKPDVRKAGGVYYTPEYIVDYIVKNTVGRLLQGLPVNKIKKLRILDPACGSGSFLIRAYEEMLNYYRHQKKLKEKQKTEEKELELKHKETEARLTIHEKSEILRQHIFGVDIDEQAVEVTKLSLMLKMLEDEHGFIPGQALLPLLDRNIRCGNSLISDEVLELKKYFGDDWYKVKPFNWKKEFKEIMVDEGGFGVVIGNPPWVSLKGKFRAEQYDVDEVKYLIECYKGDTYRPNIYEYFIKRSISLTKKGGMHSFIVPDRLTSNLQFQDLRKQILDGCKIHSLVFRAPFPGVIADTVIYVIEKEMVSSKWKIDLSEWGSPSIFVPQRFYLKNADQSFFFIANEKIADLIKKIEDVGNIPLCPNFLESNVGFIAKPNKVSSSRISKNEIRVLKGENVFRYLLRGNFYFDFTKSNLAGGTQDIKKLGIKEKILLRKTGNKVIATFDNSGDFPEQSLYFLYPNEKTKLDLKFFLALLNSRLFNFYYITMLVTNRDATPQFKKVHLDRFPILKINFTNKNDKKIHDMLVALVDIMLNLNMEIQSVRGSEKEQIQRQIEKTDKEIDDIVFKLYGIAEEECKIIESTK